MPIIDPGVTTFDDLGRPTLSPQATRLPTPPDVSAIGPVPAPNASPLQQITNNIPAPAPTNLPKFSRPTDIYQDVEQNQKPNFKDYEPHGIAKVGNVLSSLALGPFAPLIYHALQNVPYQRAQNEYQQKLLNIKPEIENQEFEEQQRNENERSKATLASTDVARKATEAHQKATEELTKQQRDEQQRKDQENEQIRLNEDVAKRRKEFIDQQLSKQKTLIEERRENEKEKSDEETKRHNRVREGIEDKREDKRTINEGTWELREDDNGKTVEYNNKTGQVRAAPQGLRPVGSKAKEDAKNAPARDALQYANDYVKENKKTGAGDEALLEKFFEFAKPSSGFRMTQPQIELLQKARGWTGSIEAKFRHATTGRWFTDDQTNEIVSTINALAAAKGIKSAPSNNTNDTSGFKINSRRDAN